MASALPSRVVQQKRQSRDVRKNLCTRISSGNSPRNDKHVTDNGLFVGSLYYGGVYVTGNVAEKSRLRPAGKPGKGLKNRALLH